MRYCLFAVSISALFFIGAGCGQLHYQGYAPTARTFSDSPDVKDYYLGIDARFAVGQPPTPHLSSQGDDFPAPVPYAEAHTDSGAPTFAAGDARDARP